MRRFSKFATGGILIIVISSGLHAVRAQDSANAIDPSSLSDQERELFDASTKFSKSTLVDGDGWASYDSFLHSKFSRWSSRSNVLDKAKTVDMIRQWWDTGNRMKSSQEDLISIQISGNTGVIRKKVTEAYIDSKGNDTGGFTGYVTHVWIKEGDSWRLLAATIEQAG